MLCADNVGLSIGPARLVDNVSLAVDAGEVLVIIGPNGAGKSSLLRILSGERRPCAGRIEMAGRPLGDWRAKAAARRRAVLSQSSDLRFPFTVREVVLIGRTPHLNGGESIRDEGVVDAAMKAAEVTHLGRRSYPTLSGGEQQRVHLARVLAQIWNEPEEGGTRYLLLDEPTSNLDVRHQHLTMRLARSMAGQGVGVIAVLHDFNLAAMYADRIAVLRNGTLAEVGIVREVLRADMFSQVFGVDVAVMDHPKADCPLIVDMAQSGTAIP